MAWISLYICCLFLLERFNFVLDRQPLRFFRSFYPGLFLPLLNLFEIPRYLYFQKFADFSILLGTSLIFESGIISTVGQALFQMMRTLFSWNIDSMFSGLLLLQLFELPLNSSLLLFCRQFLLLGFTFFHFLGLADFIILCWI